MKQIGLMTIMYHNDNDGYFVTTRGGASDGIKKADGTWLINSSRLFWHHLLRYYYGGGESGPANGGAFGCPAVNPSTVRHVYATIQNVASQTTAVAGTFPLGYGQNYYMSFTLNANNNATKQVDAWKYPSAMVTNFDDAQSGELCAGQYWDFYASSGETTRGINSRRHANGRNYLILDGHVEWLNAPNPAANKCLLRWGMNE
jgi:prepilin-type processing-associated H-X9-DG protein